MFLLFCILLVDLYNATNLKSIDFQEKMEQITLKAFDALLFPFSQDSWHHIELYSKILLMAKNLGQSLEIEKDFREILNEKRDFAVKMMNDQIAIMNQSPCTPIAYKAYETALNYATPYNAFGKRNNQFLKHLHTQKTRMETYMAEDAPTLSIYITHKSKKDSSKVHIPETPRQKEAFDTVVDELQIALNDPLAPRSLEKVKNAVTFLRKNPRTPKSSISDLISLFWIRLRLAKDSKEKKAALNALENPENFQSAANLEKWAQMMEHAGLRAKAQELRKLYIHRLIANIQRSNSHGWTLFFKLRGYHELQKIYAHARSLANSLHFAA